MEDQLSEYQTPDTQPLVRKIIGIILLVCLIWLLLPERKISQPPGVLLQDPPQRHQILPATPIPFKGHDLSLLMQYEVKARLLAKKKYKFLDRDVDLAPVDMVLGWGIMSDSEALDHLSFSIMNRNYRARYDDDAPYTWEQMAPYMDNNHLIPATDDIEDALKSVRVGSLIHLKGFLVEATKPGGYRWTSATSDGSVGETVMTCKLIYVVQFDIIKQKDFKPIAD